MMTFKSKMRFDNEQQNMQTSNANQNFRSDASVWHLLAELSLGDLLSDHDRSDEPTAGYLLQTLQELGMSPECTENIARMLDEFTKEASLRYKQGRLECLGRIRIFCQKKIIDDAAQTSRPYHTEQCKEQKQNFPDSRTNTIGGWGYFMIERGEDLPPDSSGIPHNSIDLYLYKEGE
jgi:hypothetical protein